MPDENAAKRGRYVKADIDRLNGVAVKMIRQEEAERRSKTEYLKALRLASRQESIDTPQNPWNSSPDPAEKNKA